MTNLTYNCKRTQAPILSRCCCLLPLAQQRALSSTWLIWVRIEPHHDQFSRSRKSCCWGQNTFTLWNHSRFMRIIFCLPSKSGWPYWGRDESQSRTRRRTHQLNGAHRNSECENSRQPVLKLVFQFQCFIQNSVNREYSCLIKCTV